VLVTVDVYFEKQQQWKQQFQQSQQCGSSIAQLAPITVLSHAVVPSSTGSFQPQPFLLLSRRQNDTQKKQKQNVAPADPHKRNLENQHSARARVVGHVSEH